jgi:hypothetical protein
LRAFAVSPCEASGGVSCKGIGFSREIARPAGFEMQSLRGFAFGENASFGANSSVLQGFHKGFAREFPRFS